MVDESAIGSSILEPIDIESEHDPLDGRERTKCALIMIKVEVGNLFQAFEDEFQQQGDFDYLIQQSVQLYDPPELETISPTVQLDEADDSIRAEPDQPFRLPDIATLTSAYRSFHLGISSAIDSEESSPRNHHLSSQCFKT
ncbi:hypothetical protein L6452_32804 [Arctium lappa]|uniref:Uncharacterized protein n=1 Tax=Arctium lappa TaxID=4217 RepID=A0ACB8Z607_ARCLA|nr:hypothetical protein L6452_32804 [Arctium lappa]